MSTLFGSSQSLRSWSEWIIKSYFLGGGLRNKKNDWLRVGMKLKWDFCDELIIRMADFQRWTFDADLFV
jgi:hypothetical protein